MVGFLIGTMCLIALVSTVRRERWRRGYGWRHGHGGYGPYARHGCGGRDGFDGYRDARETGFDEFGGREPWEHGGDRGGFEPRGGAGPWGGGFGRGRGRSVMLRWLFDRLRTTPEQERAIADAIDEAREQRSSFKKEARASRKDVARSVRGEQVEETVLGEVFSRHDTVIEGARKAFVHALVKIHAVLDEKQRATLADLLEGGWRAWA